MNKVAFLLLILLILFSGCKKKNDFQNLNVLLDTAGSISEARTVTENFSLFGVVTVNRLRFRTASDIHAKTIRYLDQGDILSIISKSDERVRINDVEDYWYYTEFADTKGWVFGYYIETYTSYANALNASRKYLSDTGSNVSDKVNSQFINNYIDNNLLFISDGKILAVTDSKNKKASILKTESDYTVLSYTVSPDGDYIYYLAGSGNNKSLIQYDYKNQTNEIILKNIEDYTVDFTSQKIFSVELSKTGRELNWVFKSVDISGREENIFSRIRKSPFSSDSGTSPFIKAMVRERGGDIYLEYDGKLNVVRFKPPEEDQGYLISLLDGSFIRIQLHRPVSFKIDNNREVRIENVMNTDNTMSYSLIMKDDMTGYHKEILRTSLYPMSFSLSKRNDLMAMALADTSDKNFSVSPTSVYILSLVNNELMPVSTDGFSYMPSWRK